MRRTHRRSRGLALTLGLFILIPALFQGFFRYQYFTVGNTVWRIDRLTQQACRTNARPLVCTAPAPLLQWPASAPATESHKWFGSTFDYAVLRQSPLRHAPLRGATQGDNEGAGST